MENTVLDQTGERTNQTGQGLRGDAWTNLAETFGIGIRKMPAKISHDQIDTRTAVEKG